MVPSPGERGTPRERRDVDPATPGAGCAQLARVPTRRQGLCFCAAPPPPQRAPAAAAAVRPGAASWTVSSRLRGVPSLRSAARRQASSNPGSAGVRSGARIVTVTLPAQPFPSPGRGWGRGEDGGEGEKKDQREGLSKEVISAPSELPFGCNSG